MLSFPAFLPQCVMRNYWNGPYRGADVRTLRRSAGRSWNLPVKKFLKPVCVAPHD